MLKLQKLPSEIQSRIIELASEQNICIQSMEDIAEYCEEDEEAMELALPWVVEGGQ